MRLRSSAHPSPRIEKYYIESNARPQTLKTKQTKKLKNKTGTGANLRDADRGREEKHEENPRKKVSPSPQNSAAGSPLREERLDEGETGENREAEEENKGIQKLFFL